MVRLGISKNQFIRYYSGCATAVASILIEFRSVSLQQHAEL